MKTLGLATAILALTVAGGTFFGSPGTANAEDFNVRVGVGDGHHHGWRHGHHWRGHYAQSRCRVVVRHRINGHGDRVTVRKRICD